MKENVGSCVAGMEVCCI